MSTLPERFRVPRGSSERKTDFMEQYQIAWIRAIAAASGTIVSGFSVDDGVDVGLKQRHQNHQGDGVARVEVQLKATAFKPSGGFARARMSRRRFNEFATLSHVHKIVVVMVMPKEPVHWLWASRRSLNLFGNCYWVNLAGESRPGSGESVTVYAPTSNVLDDVALAKIMERVGKGGRP